MWAVLGNASCLARKFVTCLMAAVLVLLALARPCPAFQPVRLASDDIRIIESPRLDFWVRLEMIRSARRSVDLVLYDMRPDSGFTMPLLSAIRDAADRGVMVRILVPWVTLAYYDLSDSIERYLRYPKTTMPILFLIFGGPGVEGLNFIDAPHEKLMIVDGRKVLISGRGFADDYLYWLDTSFGVKGRLVYQSVNAFNRLWRLARSHQRPSRHDDTVAAPIRRYEPPARMQPGEAEREELRAALDWYSTPAAGPFCGEGRLLQHNFIDQMRSLPDHLTSGSVRDRVSYLEDNVVDALVERIGEARSIRISTLAAMLHPRLTNALVDAARRPGTDVTLLTNGAAPTPNQREKRPVRPWGPMWAAQLPDLVRLGDAGVALFQFEVSADTPWVYNHRKLAIMDDVVIFGSHNFNLPSTVANDEISIEARCPDLAVAARELFDRDLAANSRRLDLEWLRAQESGWKDDIIRFFTMPFIGLM